MTRLLGTGLALLASAVLCCGAPVCCLAGRDCCDIAVAAREAAAADASPRNGASHGCACRHCRDRAPAAPRPARPDGFRPGSPAGHAFGCACAERSLARLAHGTHAGPALPAATVGPASFLAAPRATPAPVPGRRGTPPGPPGSLLLPLLL